jgi:hypothetical protein
VCANTGKTVGEPHEAETISSDHSKPVSRCSPKGARLPFGTPASTAINNEETRGENMNHYNIPDNLIRIMFAVNGDTMRG